MTAIENKIKRYWKDMVIMTTVILIPFAFYLYNAIPQGVKTLKLAFFEIESGFYEDVNQLVWVCSVKILTLILLSIWFITCKYRWRWVILVPIALEIHKLTYNIIAIKKGFNFNSSITETFIYSIPYAFILIFVSVQLGYQNRIKNDMTSVHEEINNELGKLSKFNIQEYNNVKLELNKLKTNKQSYTKKKYLTELIALRDRLNHL